MNLDFFRNIESSTKENKVDDNEEFIIDRFEGDFTICENRKTKEKNKTTI